MTPNGRIILGGIALAVLIPGALGCQPDAAVPLASNDSVEASVAGGPSGGELVLPVLETYADTVAMRVYEASGGPAAWQDLPLLRFSYSIQNEGRRVRTVQHFWNRITGHYRLEMRGPGGQPYIVLFNVKTRQGWAYWKGDSLDVTGNAEQMAIAYRRFINDTYWLLAPFKLFDPGVHRAYAPDSSDAATDAIHLTFDDASMTPGDQYWLFVNKETGRLIRWTYVLPDDGPDTPPRSFIWDTYEEHVMPGGSLLFSTRKRGVGTPVAIYTEAIETPTLVPKGMFTVPDARLRK